MGSLGCPLCCQQDFVSVVALHDHLLYYTYRPLQCAICSAHVGGIQELTHHLERHMGDGMPTLLQTHRIKPMIPVVDNSKLELLIQDQPVTKEKTSTRDVSGSNLCNLFSNDGQVDNLRTSLSEEPIELILRAYFCQTCGAKIVGKDAYFVHVKEHSVVPSINVSQTLLPIVGSCPESTSPASQSEAISCNFGSAVSTPGNITTETENLMINDTDDPSECLSDIMEEKDTANQLRKLREWQLEKLGKGFNRNKISFVRSPGISELSPISGKITYDNSPMTPSSIGRRPLNENNLSPCSSRLSDNSYTYSGGRNSSCNAPSLSTDPGTVEKLDLYNPLPSVDREAPNTKPYSGGRPDYCVASPLTDTDSLNVNPCSAERFDSSNAVTPSAEESLAPDSNTTRKQPDSSLQLVQSSIDFLHNSMQDLSSNFSKVEPNTVTSDDTSSLDFLVTTPSSVSQVNSVQTESISQSDHALSLRVETEMPLYQSIDKPCAYEDVQNAISHPCTFETSIDITNIESRPHLENIDPPIFTLSSWDCSQQTSQELKLQSFSKTASSLPLFDKVPCAHVLESSGQKSELQESIHNDICSNVQFLNSSGSSSQSLVLGKSNNCNEVKSSNIKSVESNLEDCTNLTNYNSYSEQMRSTEIQDNSTDILSCDNVKEAHISDKEIVQCEENCKTDNRKHIQSDTSEIVASDVHIQSDTSEIVASDVHIQGDTSEIVACDVPTNYDDSGNMYTDCINQVNHLPDDHDIDNIAHLPGDAMPYFHKKFHHDQERKVVGQCPDVNRYIHSFQSLLVSKLNGTLSTDNNPFGSNGINPDMSANTVCIMQDNDPVNLSSKAQQQPQIKEYACEVCNLKYTSQSTYRLHYKTHEVEGQKNFSCQFCGQRFFRKCSKDLHERKHTGRKVHRCGECLKVFAKLCSYLRHQREVHALSKTFICAECSKAFTTERRLKEHIGVHQREKAHKCIHCKHSCHTASGLRTHILELHSGTRKSSHSCEVCGAKFAKQYGLKRHKQRKHTKQQLACEICSKTFSCKEDLLQHTKYHTDLETLTCKECEKTFTTSWGLQRHSESHQETTYQFHCNKCSLNFTRKDSLVSHLKIHAQKRPFICHCGRRFLRKCQLKEHENKHSKIAKYSCDTCKHSFKFKVSLRNHSCKHKTPSESTAHEEQS
ncbi:uncharacterized protein [Procambarus clarkii]|uniref:uncharacterized protein isoform X1 n=1 Tax=Procambarus clarkii TaxID=6728 RepID=UPI00374233CC